MDEKLQFVARRLAGESMAELCREFGISRKTGYKIFQRYKDCDPPAPSARNDDFDDQSALSPQRVGDETDVLSLFEKSRRPFGSGLR
ncbi:MAG TPA: helix-turn-helix domain-containing protein [Anaerolineales bacterium]